MNTADSLPTVADSGLTEGFVPVSGPFIAFVAALQAFWHLALSETALADHLKMASPRDYHLRCRDYFFKETAPAARILGLALNEQTFNTLLTIQIPQEIVGTSFDDLPKRYAFNPWLNLGYGGICRLS